MNKQSNIVQELEAKGWSEADIAAYVGKTTKSVQNWRAGVHNPVGENLRKLQEMLTKPVRSGGNNELVMYDIGIAIKKMEATTDVMLAAVAEILAEVKHQPTTVVRDQLEKLVNARLSSSEPGQ